MAKYSMLMVMNQGDDFNKRIEQIKEDIGNVPIKIGGIFEGSLNTLDGKDVSFCLVKDLNLELPNISRKKEILKKHYYYEKGLDTGRYSMLTNEYAHPNLYISTASSLSFDSIYNFGKDNWVDLGLITRLKTGKNLHNNRKKQTIEEWNSFFREDVYPNLNDEDVLMVLEVSESDKESFGKHYDNKEVTYSNARNTYNLLDSQGDYYRETVKKREDKERLNKEKYLENKQLTDNKMENLRRKRGIK